MTRLLWIPYVLGCVLAFRPICGWIIGDGCLVEDKTDMTLFGLLALLAALMWPLLLLGLLFCQIIVRLVQPSVDAIKSKPNR